MKGTRGKVSQLQWMYKLANVNDSIECTTGMTNVNNSHKCLILPENVQS